MAKSMDDLLNSIKREYSEEKTPEAPPAPSSQPASSSASSQSASSQSASSQPAPIHPPSPATSIDNLLNDIGVKTPEPKPSEQKSTPPSMLFPTVRSSAPSPSPSSMSFPSSQSAATGSVLNQVKAQYDAEAAERELQRQQALEADRRLQRQLEEQQRREREAEQERQRHLEEKQRVTRLKRVQDWLDNLDPNSDEGFWFESFAAGYPSKFDAASDYLSAMDEVS